MIAEFESELLEHAVTELSRLPGVGRKTALRLALHLLRREPSETVALVGALTELRERTRYCRVCHNISAQEVCPICASESRDRATVCVVENVRDVMIIESTGRYSGVYHVLGGVISPVDGITPDQLEINSLVERVAAGGVREVMLALGATMEGDTTSYYIYRKVRAAVPDILVTQLSRGMSVGNDLEYTDEITLGRSIERRTPFEDGLAL